MAEPCRVCGGKLVPSLRAGSLGISVSQGYYCEDCGVRYAQEPKSKHRWYITGPYVLTCAGCGQVKQSGADVYWACPGKRETP